MTLHAVNIAEFSARKPRAGKDLRGRRILVVEDQYCIADDVAEALAARGGHVVGPVPTIDRALGLIESDRLDGAIVDINLRGEFAYAVADALRSRAIPFIFATGYDRKTIPARFRDVGLCSKPFDGDTVIEMLFSA